MLGTNGSHRAAGIARARHLLIACLALLALLGAANAIAQQPGALPRPDAALWAEGSISVIVRESDGSLLVGGSFSRIKGVARQGLARILPDGSVDLAFDAQLFPESASVSDLHVTADGSIVLAGSFSNVGGLSLPRLAKVAPATGAPDASWAPAPNGNVVAIEPGQAGELFVAGFFSSIGGQSRNTVAKLAASGAVDATWDAAPNQSVSALAFDAANDDLYIGGAFTAMGGQTRGRLARVDASGTGAVQAWTADADYHVNVLLLDGSSLYAAGPFLYIAGAPRSGLVRLSTDGASAVPDPAFAPDASSVDALVREGSSLYIAGSFLAINGAGRTGVAALAVADGALLPFAPVLGLSADNSLPNARVFAFGDGTVHIGGIQSYVNGERRLGYAALSSDGTLLPATVDVLRAGSAEVLLPLPAGGMLVGGHFHEVDAAAHAYLFKLDANGVPDPQWAPQFDGIVRALALSADGNSVYVGGDFDNVDGAAAGHIARVSLAGAGAHDAAFAAHADAQVVALAVAADGSVYAGGGFAAIGGLARPYLARLSATDGSAIAAFGANDAIDGTVAALALSGSGVLVGGNFGNVGAAARTRLARLDASSGAADASFVADIGGGSPASLLVDGSALYVSGYFASIGGVAQANVARVDAASGNVDLSFAPTVNNQIEAVARIGDAVYIGGAPFNINGQVRYGVARLSVAGAALDPDWKPELYDGFLATLAASADGELFIAGSFRNVYTTRRQGLAALPAEMVQLSLSVAPPPAVVYEDQPVQIAITVGASSGSADDLVLSAVSSNTGAISDTTLAAGLGGSGANRTLLLQAQPDVNSNTVITVTLQGGGTSTQASFSVDVRMVNDAPTLTLAGNVLHPAGSSGDFVRAGFANAAANDPMQSVNYIVRWLRDPQGVVPELQIHPDGSLLYTLSGNSGGALYSVQAQDSGDTANGGNNLSDIQYFRVLVGDGANLAVSITPDAGATTMAKGSTLAAYTVRVTNHGPDDVPAGIVLQVPTPAGTSDMLWTCRVPVGDCNPAAAGGAVNTSFGLAVGAIAEVAISLRLGGSDFVDFAATTALPDGVSAIDTGESQLRVSMPATADAIFRGRFE